MKARILFLVICILLIADGVQAQTSTGNVRMSNEPVSSEPFRSLLFSLDFASNTDLIGKLGESIKQPSFTASLSFIGKSGFDATAIASFISNSNDSMDGFTSEFDLMLGYQFRLFSGLTLYPGYSRFIYGRESNALQSIFTDELYVDVAFSHRFFNLGVTPGFYFGRQHTFYSALRNSYSINFNDFIFRNSLLNIQPGLDLNFGSFEYLNRFYVDLLKQNDGFYQYLLFSREVRHYVYTEKTRNPELTVFQILDQYLEEMVQDRFRLTSATLYLPVNYFIGNFCLNAGIYLFLPVHQPDYLYNETQFFYSMGITYNLDFRR